jgi:hypothetical protein
MPIIVVGSVDVYGNREPYSSGLNNEISTSAAGTVRCPFIVDGRFEYRVESGTSFGMT